MHVAVLEGVFCGSLCFQWEAKGAFIPRQPHLCDGGTTWPQPGIASLEVFCGGGRDGACPRRDVVGRGWLPEVQGVGSTWWDTATT